MTIYDPVRAASIIAHNGLQNASKIVSAAHQAGLGLPAACALMQSESGGRNVYGHDEGGALSGYPEVPNKSNYLVFRWLIDNQGYLANGVGPAQITSLGLLDQMELQGLRPWRARDNMLFGFRLLQGYFKVKHTWRYAGTRYNGAEEYGDRLADRVERWTKLLKPAEV